MPVTGLGEIAGLLAAVTWGTTGLLIRAQGTRLPSLAINALRTSVAALLLVGVWPLFGGPRPVALGALGFLVASLALGLGLGDGLYFEAIRRIGVARAMPISMGYPAITALLAVTLLGEAVDLASLAGIALTLGGVYLVASPTRHTTLHQDAPPTDWGGAGLAAAAAVCWAGATISIRAALDQVDAATANAVRLPLASALLLLVAWQNHALPSWGTLRGRALAFVIATGLTSGVSAAFFLLAVEQAGAARAAVLSSTAPIFAVPMSVLYLGERANWRMAVGTVASVGGVVLLTLSAAR